MVKRQHLAPAELAGSMQGFWEPGAREQGR